MHVNKDQGIGQNTVAVNKAIPKALHLKEKDRP